MSVAPGRGGSGGDFLKGLPDTGYRPWEQKAQRKGVAFEPKLESTESEIPDDDPNPLMTLLQSLVETAEPVHTDELERRCAAEGVRTSQFYAALGTLLDTDLAQKGPAGVSLTEAGRKLAAFKAR